MNPNSRAPLDDPVIARGPLGALPPTLEWVGGRDGHLRLLDQTRLPAEVVYRVCTTAAEVWEAIRVLRVRGAPAIGVAAGYGLCLGLREHRGLPAATFMDKVGEVAQYLRGCRPTAVNLAWALERLTNVARTLAASAAARAMEDGGVANIWDGLLAEAHAMAREDAETCLRIGEHGAALVPDGGGVLTHCNAGALATVAFGTALSVLYVAHRRGRRFKVYADETRPLLQGARLTAYELSAAGLDVTLLCDNAAAALMHAGRVQMVVVGADRITANGDTANKIGTYGVALAARHHGIPFYVAAPRSTFDLSLASGAAIPIEHRDADEVRRFGGQVVAPEGIECFNPAFDVTPASLITGIITDAGIVEPVTNRNVERVFA